LVRSLTEAAERPAAFVLMPFGDDFDWLFADAILPALSGAGFEARRADTLLNQRNILQDIVHGIANARLVVADLTGLNANVMYELGLAHGLQKPTIILSRDLSSVPFDLKGYRVLVYSTQFRDVQKLIATLTEIGEQHLEGKLTFGNPVTDFGNRVEQVLVTNNDYDNVANDESGSLTRSREEFHELGVVDIYEVIESEAKRISDWAQELGNQTAALAPRLQADLVRVTPKSGNKSLNVTAMRTASSAISAHLDEWSDLVGRDLPAIEDSWHNFGEAIEALVKVSHLRSETDRRSAETLIAEMTEFGQTMLGVKVVFDSLGEDVQGLSGVSSDVSKSVVKFRDVLSQIARQFEVGIALAGRLVTVLKERLDESNGA